MASDLTKAKTLALAVPAALMLGALGSQYIGGLYPCEMCHWQRWPHEAALVFALFAIGLRNEKTDRLFVALAALGIFISGAIGVFHAGVEYKWWEGLTTCSTTAAGLSIEDIMSAPMIRCDEPQWKIFGISMAGFNAMISIGAALYIAALLKRGR